MGEADIRQYAVHARSTDTFGRVLCNAGHHYFVVDGPIQNGCPGEAITPADLFLSGVAACGVELVQVLAKAQNVPLERVSVNISGVIDRGNPVRKDLSVFNSVRLEFLLEGVTVEQAHSLIDGFKAR